MSSNDNIEEKDIFSQFVKNKLENYQLPVDESVWEKIEQRMSPSRKRVIPTVWYGIFGGIAAALALLLILKPLDNSKSTPNVAKNTHVATEHPEQTQSAVTEPKKEVAGNLNTNKKLSAEKIIDTYKKNSAPYAGVKNAHVTISRDFIANNTDGISKTIPDNKNTESEEQQAVVKESEEKKKNPKEKESKREIIRLPDLNDYPGMPATIKKARKKRPLLLAAAVGVGGSLSAPEENIPANLPPMRNRSLVKSEIALNYASVLDVTDYTEAKHYPPLSVGVTAAKSLNDIFSLESGLVYTYLKSDYHKPGLTNYRGVLQLHYLGIPLNVRAKAVNKPKWDLYLSAGGMIEKGVYSRYDQEKEMNEVVANTDVKSSVDGVQWSLNGALGADYKIRKGMSLFIEPKVTYYLQNNQPMSARTEQPLSFGMSGGLRIEL